MVHHLQPRGWREARRTLIVCHDAGGAEVVSSWVRRNPRPETVAILEGPAIDVFGRKLRGLKRLQRSKLSECIAEADFVLAGSSWASNLEREAIGHAARLNVPIAVFLDHWVNYPERFKESGQIRLPTEIWVCDTYAEAIAKACFPRLSVNLVRNPYFDDICEELRPLLEQRSIEPGTTRILYVTEPITEHVAKGTASGHFTEFDALGYALRRIRERHRATLTSRTRVRLHPAEPVGKYDSILAQYADLPIEISSGNTLIQDCAWSDQVVGCESMAMVVALLASRKVYTSIPPGGRRCRLPHTEIEPI